MYYLLDIIIYLNQTARDTHISLSLMSFIHLKRNSYKGNSTQEEQGKKFELEEGQH